MKSGCSSPSLLPLALLLVCLLCGSGIAAKPLTVAYLGYSTEKPFWVALGQMVQQEADRQGLQLIDLTPPSNDGTLQAPLLDHAVKKRVAGIILGANRPELLLPALDNALQQQIPLVAIDTRIDHPAVRSLIATDNRAGAELAGEYIARLTGGKGTLLILGGTPGHPNGEIRRTGVTAAAEAAGLTVQFRYADWENEKAYRITSEELRKQQLAAIFACWDPGIDTAAYLVEQLHLPQRPLLVGFDGLPQTLERIRAGTVDATVAQNPQQMGRLSVTTLLKILRGEDYQQTILVPPTLIERQNLPPKNKLRQD